MKNVRKRTKILLGSFIAVIIVILVVVMAMIINPLLRTEAGIRRHLLRIAPIGMSMEDVIRIADNNRNWNTIRICEDAGVILHPSLLIPMRMSPSDPRFPVVGEKSVRVHLGTTRIILRADVTAFFAFDENGELIEILVRREYDVI